MLGLEGWPAESMKRTRLMILVQKLLAPGPGSGMKSTFRWSPFQSALSGSLFFMPQAMPQVFDSVFEIMQLPH